MICPLPKWLTKPRQIPCPAWMCAIRDRLGAILFEDNTTNTRMLFGFTTMLFGYFMAFSPTVHSNLSEYKLMLTFAPDWAWAIGFTINGAAYMYGAYTNRYGKVQLYLEGTLGVTVWTASAYAVVVTQQTIGAQCAGALIAFWLYVRYPTHWERIDGL